MRDMGIHRQQSPQGEHRDGSHQKKAAQKDAAAFADAVRDGKQAGASTEAEGEEKTTAELLQEARKNLISSTARLVQQNAKDIERENIDKGF